MLGHLFQWSPQMVCSLPIERRYKWLQSLISALIVAKKRGDSFIFLNAINVEHIIAEIVVAIGAQIALQRIKEKPVT